MSDKFKELKEALTGQFPELDIRENMNSAELSSFRCGGSIRTYIEVANMAELKSVLQAVDKAGLPHLILGNGTNTLFRDGLYEGVVIKLSEDSPYLNYVSTNVQGKDYIEELPSHFRFEPGEKIEVEVGASMLLSTFARLIIGEPETASGLEALSGIPGSVGGAAFMNAGAYGSEMKDVIKSVHAVSPDGSVERDFANSEMEFGYRHSVLMDNGYIVTSVTFELIKGDRVEIAARMNEFTRKRVSKQPLNYPSCGSTFKRPEGNFAGKLIEDAGLKGISVGSAEVSTLHAGFVINKGGATATDVLQLMSLIQNTVYDKFGVKLEPEIRII